MEQPNEEDNLCSACASVGLFTLFTGPRYYPSSSQRPSSTIVALSTLSDILSNTHCSLCRLIYHVLYTDPYSPSPVLSQPWSENFANPVNPAKVLVSLQPIRADYHGEMRFTNEKTKDKIATSIEVRLSPLEGADISEAERHTISQHRRACGIQLLSPGSVDPERPLMNGYHYTNTETSINLLRKWMDTCVEKHTSVVGSEICQRPQLPNLYSQHDIRVIDVNQRTIISRKPDETSYAALSYVWSQAPSPISNLDTTQGASNILPGIVPKVIEDSISVCQALSIPYLWVDRHCIDQNDPLAQSREIESMAFRYLSAKITFVAGGLIYSDYAMKETLGETEVGLLPIVQKGRKFQRVETIQGKQYITTLPDMFTQIIMSPWLHRAWTMQEGQLANRIAFFGNFDIAFLCGSGQWRESHHSGVFGHESMMNQEDYLEMRCEGYHMLGWPKWTKDAVWRFEDYSDLLMSYTARDRLMTYESDKINAITGCLNFIGTAKNTSFYHGLPLTDFHYALIWMGAYDRPRTTFPSWSWAGWHSLQNRHNIHPLISSNCTLSPKSEDTRTLITISPPSPYTEAAGLLVSLTERVHNKNKCYQHFAHIEIPDYKCSSILHITAPVVHFHVDILASSLETRVPNRTPWLDVADAFDSTMRQGGTVVWDMNKEYRTPFSRLRLTDGNGNMIQYHYPRWYDHPPPTMFCIPKTLRGSSISWLLNKGIDLVMILDLEIVEAEEGLEPFHLVFCLGVDDREEVGKRFGMFVLPKEDWERACPVERTVKMG